MHRAVAICKQIGGKLFEPKSATEMAAALNLVKKNRGSHFWIGLHDKTREGHFTYGNGRSISYTNWATSEPNNYGRGEDCVEAYASYQPGKWNDRACSANRAFVCERLSKCKAKGNFFTIVDNFSNRYWKLMIFLKAKLSLLLC